MTSSKPSFRTRTKTLARLRINEFDHGNSLATDGVKLRDGCWRHEMPEEHRDPRTLRDHPTNATLYGSELDANFLEQVRRDGRITHAIHILPDKDNTIVDGHLPKQAPIELQFASVPVKVRDDLRDKDPRDFEVEEQILSGNEQRKKTNEHRAREFKLWLKIEKEKAKLRQIEGASLKGDEPSKLTEEEKGPAREKAAKRSGWRSPRTAECAAAGVDAIDNEGDSEEGKKHRELLNRAPHAAFKYLTCNPEEEKDIDRTKARLLNVPWLGMEREPENENGVIFLFGVLAKRLGFHVERIRGKFPDCRANEVMPNGKVKQVEIEFEFKSVSFRNHLHNSDDCDIIVCWEHNWTGCPIRVIELQKEIEKLQGTSE